MIATFIGVILIVFGGVSISKNHISLSVKPTG